MRSALVVGADGQIGGALMQALLRQGVDVAGTTRKGGRGRARLDLAAQPGTWQNIHTCEVAFLCAAITKLDTCEAEPEATKLVNVTRTLMLARQLHEAGTYVVFLSTNHVFDGSVPHVPVTAPFSPRNEYGRQKVAVEEGFKRLPHSGVLRLTKVVTEPFPLLDGWAEKLKRGEPIQAFTDMVMAPVTLQAVTTALARMGEEKRRVTHQISAPEQMSYYEIGRLLARLLGADEALVEQASARERGIPAHFLPAFTTYRNTLPGMSSIEDVVRRSIKEKRTP